MQHFIKRYLTYVVWTQQSWSQPSFPWYWKYIRRYSNGIETIEFFSKVLVEFDEFIEFIEMFHGYVNVVIYGNLTIIDQFLW